MFHATEREATILRTLAGSSSIEEAELFKALSEKSPHPAAQTFKNAIEGCIVKGFVQKLEENKKSFYKITDSGKNQI